MPVPAAQKGISWVALKKDPRPGSKCGYLKCLVANHARTTCMTYVDSVS